MQSVKNFHLRDAAESDFQKLWELNQSERPHVNDLSRDEFFAHAKTALRIRVADQAGAIAAFLMLFDQTSNYQSLNFQYFKKHYPRFVYIDRVVVSKDHRRQGIARALYDDVAQFANGRYQMITSEVNLKPANPESVLFHSKYGFREVGQQDTEGGKKRVSLLVKALSDS